MDPSCVCVCVSVCHPHLPPSVLYNRGPRPQRLTPWALGTWPPSSPMVQPARGWAVGQSRPVGRFLVSLMQQTLFSYDTISNNYVNLDHYVKKAQSEQLEALYPTDVHCMKHPSSVSNHRVSTHKLDS